MHADPAKKAGQGGLDSQHSGAEMGDPIRCAPGTSVVAVEGAPNGVSLPQPIAPPNWPFRDFGFSPFRERVHFPPAGLSLPSRTSVLAARTGSKSAAGLCHDRGISSNWDDVSPGMLSRAVRFFQSEKGLDFFQALLVIYQLLGVYLFSHRAMAARMAALICSSGTSSTPWNLSIPTQTITPPSGDSCKRMPFSTNGVPAM